MPKRGEEVLLPVKDVGGGEEVRAGKRRVRVTIPQPVNIIN